jgi:predicted Holliday junction resolvase-like endonuclease
MLEVVVAVIVIGIGLNIAWALYLLRLVKQAVQQKQQPQTFTVNTDTNVFDQKVAGIKKDIDKLPEEILHSLTGSANTHKGKIGELIGYIQLKSEYDKIIPLGGIVDFVGIKLPDGDESGRVDFIDIKTGQNARLSKEQRAFRDILKKKEIYFKTVKIDEIDGVHDDSPSD